MQKLVLSILILLFHPSTYALVIESSAEGLGFESLMGGIGTARLGSAGALGSNPALLAWLPKKQVFISTNQLSFYKLKTESGQKLNVTPDVVPRFAASSEGFDQWGHSYGFIINKMKVGVDSESDGQRTTGTQEDQYISFSYGFGFKIFNNTAFGLVLSLNRLQQDGNFSVLGESEGQEFAFTLRDRITFWAQGISLGLASKVDSWAFGLTSKFAAAKFWALGSQEQSGYHESLSTNMSQVEHKTPFIKIIPDIRAGIQKKLEEHKLFFDVSYTPSYSDPDFDEYYKAQLAYGFGIEGSLTEVYNWYSGLSHGPGPVGEDDDSGSLSVGVSKKNKHSYNYAGLSWTRPYKSGEYELVQINFGTQFDY